mgnify:CR=1 FL=1
MNKGNYQNHKVKNESSGSKVVPIQISGWSLLNKLQKEMELIYIEHVFIRRAKK